MAGGVKRAASKGAVSKKVAKKCKSIELAVRGAESLPQPVRKIIGGRLGFVFGTYKEDRHAFQNTVSALVGQTLKTTETNLQATINAANQAKAAQEAEGATLSATNDQAGAASEAAAQAASGAKDALNSSSAALRDAKSALQAAENAVKTNDSDTSSTAAKKEKLEALVKEFFALVKEGSLDKGLSKSAAWAGKQLGKEFGSVLESEFLSAVVRTFSKASAAWGTFDHIIDKELEQEIQKIVAGLGSQLARLESEKATCVAGVESAQAAVGAATEAEKAAEEASKGANTFAKAAKATAGTATSMMKTQQKAIDKASHSAKVAEDALKAFGNGAIAAYQEVEAHTAPPPPPEPVVEETPAAAVQEAMAPAPAPAQRAASPRMLPSPAVLLQTARNLLPSPRILQSPQTS